MSDTSKAATSRPTPSGTNATSSGPLEYTGAFLLLRLFLGLRTFLAGVEKYEANKEYSFSIYYENMNRMAAGISNNSFIPMWAAKSYAMPLGYLLLLLGLAILLGIKSRITLFVTGLVYVSLGFGLMAVQEGEGIAWIGMQVLMFAVALLLVRHDRFALWRD